MNWIKNQIEGQHKADQEEQERRQKETAADAEQAKKLTAVSYSAFAKLIAAIRADVDSLNEAKQGQERFGTRTDERTTLEFYKIGQVPETRLSLALEPNQGHIRYEQMIFRRGSRSKGHIDISIDANGEPSLQVRNRQEPTFESPQTSTSYEELSQFLLSPTF